MELIEVKDKRSARDFLDVARKIYIDDPNWICPLDEDINAVFDHRKNTFFTHGDAIRWVLKSDGKLVGRVAAFINEKKAYTYKQPTGGMGFFECIQDREAAFMLFNKCRDWLSERGMKAMDGPINFGENDNFWGLLVEGFMPQGLGMTYNPAYYRDFFESYGFKPYFEQVTNHLDLTKKFPERFWKIADWIRQKPGFKYEHLELKNVEKYIDDLKTVYDQAWAFHENFTPINKIDLWNSFEKSKPIIDEEMIWFVYHENEPIAFLVMFPDANQILRHFNGKMNLWNKIRFLWYKKRHEITRTRIVIMGVVPKFQKYGVESGIFWNMKKVMDRKPWYKEIELSWVGDFNPKMRKLHESVGAYFAKKHITFRKLFDTESSFERSSVIPMDTKEKTVGKQLP